MVWRGINFFQIIDLTWLPTSIIPGSHTFMVNKFLFWCHIILNAPLLSLPKWPPFYYWSKFKFLFSPFHFLLILSLFAMDVRNDLVLLGIVIIPQPCPRVIHYSPELLWLHHFYFTLAKATILLKHGKA